MTTSSRNPAVRNMIKLEGEQAVKDYVRDYYGIPAEVDDWKTIDKMAQAKQEEMNKVQAMNK